VLQSVAVCCRVVQCVAERLQCVVERCKQRVITVDRDSFGDQSVAVCCGALQCVAQCGAVCYSVLNFAKDSGQD